MDVDVRSFETRRNRPVGARAAACSPAVPAHLGAVAHAPMTSIKAIWLFAGTDVQARRPQEPSP